MRWIRTEINLIQGKQFVFWKNSFNIFIIWYLKCFNFKVHDVLYCTNFPFDEDPLQYFLKHPLLGQVMFEYILYPIYFLILLTNFIYITSFFITITIKWYFCWYSWWWGFSSVFFWSRIYITLIHSRHPCNRHWSRITVLCTTATTELLAFKKLFLNELLRETEWS